MGWIQDIVPNHMAMDSENEILMDILVNGYNSQYFNFFDVDWGHLPAGPNKNFSRHFLADSMGSV